MLRRRVAGTAPVQHARCLHGTSPSRGLGPRSDGAPRAAPPRRRISATALSGGPGAPTLTAVEVLTAQPRSRTRRARAFVALTKPRIIELLLITTVPTMVVAEQGIPSVWLMVATVLGGTLAAGGANAINMYVDRDIDKIMERTRNRPLVTGEVAPREALVFAIAIEVAAFFWLWATVNLLSAALAVAACLFYVFVYTLWLKRSSSSNIVIGGAAGAAPVLIGWSAVTNSLDWPPVVLFAVIFYWTPPHFWALAIKYREDYSAAEVPMLPSVVSTRTTADPHDRLHGRPVGPHARLRAGGRHGSCSTSSRPSCSAPSSW